MPLSGEAIRTMNYVDDISVTLRRILTVLPSLTDEERNARRRTHQGLRPQLRLRPQGRPVVQVSGFPDSPAPNFARARRLHATRPTTTTTIQTVAVIGAGTQGRHSRSSVSAPASHVVLEDVMPAKLRRAEEVVRLFRPARKQRSPCRLALTVEDAVRDADLAIDFVPDELESKLEIFCMIDRMAPPRTIMVTPTNALSITDLASCTYRGQLCFGLRGSSPSCRIRIPPPRPHRPRQRRHRSYRGRDAFLNKLGVSPILQTDADAPMLVKNAL